MREHLYNTADIAIVIDVAEQTILRLARSGKLKGYKIGNRWRFSCEDVERYLEARAFHPRAGARHDG